MVKWTLMILCSVVLATANAQHTPLTSQYLFNGLLINPAYAGSRDALATNLTWRNQWVGFEGAPKTQVLSVHAPLNRRKMGLGVLLYNDQIGVSRETGVFLNYAYRIRFRKGKLSFGLGGGITLLKAQWTDVRTTRSDDASFGQDTRSSLKPNFSAVAFYYKKKFFMGASVPFFISHRYNPARNSYTVTNDVRQYQPMITGGYVFDLNKKMKLKPSAAALSNERCCAGRPQRESHFQRQGVARGQLPKRRCRCGYAGSPSEAPIALRLFLRPGDLRYHPVPQWYT